MLKEYIDNYYAFLSDKAAKGGSIKWIENHKRRQKIFNYLLIALSDYYSSKETIKRMEMLKSINKQLKIT